MAAFIRSRHNAYPIAPMIHRFPLLRARTHTADHACALQRTQDLANKLALASKKLVSTHHAANAPKAARHCHQFRWLHRGQGPLHRLHSMHQCTPAGCTLHQQDHGKDSYQGSHEHPQRMRALCLMAAVRNRSVDRLAHDVDLFGFEEKCRLSIAEAFAPSTLSLS